VARIQAQRRPTRGDRRIYICPFELRRIGGKGLWILDWGIDDKTHEIIGTSLDPDTARKGAEELESWLLRLLQPRIDFGFQKTQIEGKPVVVLQIGKAFRHPVQFAGVEYLRIGSYKKKLKDFPEKERELWKVFEESPFEDCPAETGLNQQEVLEVLDYPAYFRLLDLPLPSNATAVLEALASDELVRIQDDGGWTISNLGVLLLAHNVTDFRTVRRKGVRIVVYRGTNRVIGLREVEVKTGYATGFENLVATIDNLLPRSEAIGQALRASVPIYPELAIRELLANALIHQDLAVTGASPMVEIFENRMEITNPGEPLVDPLRFLDSPPRSRNEALAAILKRMGICEERGSGIDKVVHITEMYQLPAPEFSIPEGSTRAVLLCKRSLRDMTKEDQIRAC
jgi:predicted HTH transcriptional regulator